MPLRELLRWLPSARIVGDDGVRVESIVADSRDVHSGSLFAALRGTHADGHRYVRDAITRGASAVLVEDEPPAADATAVIVDDTARALSCVAAQFYGDPSQDLTIVGITGTNGKTTTVQMVATILNQAGVPCASVGTIGARFRERITTLQHTTPFAPQLQGLLAEFRQRGARAAALEISSHALAQHRADDVRFEVGALTNVTRDHLDFHQTMEAYAAAKRRLFTLAATCVFNADDQYGRRWAADFARLKPVVTYGLHTDAAVRATQLQTAADESSFSVDGTRFRVRLPGKFNVANALCAIGCARSIGISDQECARALESLERVPGRTEQVARGGLRVMVDYAHTPDALDRVLSAVREHCAKLILVFGCGGDRDRGKRAEMGAVAARWADYIYVTSDNPRSEDPATIAREIVRGVDGAAHAVELDRRAAIEQAIARGAPGDMVVIAGKGHEAYQIVGDRVLPFDDLAVARAVLNARAAVTP